MAYRLHRDGYIQTCKVEFELPDEVIRRATQFGDTRVDGILRELLSSIGIEIEDAENVRVDGRRVILTSSWARPSRR